MFPRMPYVVCNIYCVPHVHNSRVHGRFYVLDLKGFGRLGDFHLGDSAIF